MKMRLALLVCAVLGLRAVAAEPDLILHNAKIVTVNSDFIVEEAIAIKGGRITEVGGSTEVLATAGPSTRRIDMHGRTVLPGLIDSHTHPTGACMTEFDHEIPAMETIVEVLAYIRGRVAKVKPGDWIILQQVFITRLKEQRYPTRAELDAAALENPVLYRVGPDAMCNSLALKLSGIDRDFKITDGSGGFVELDPKTGEPTGVLRNATRFVKSKSTAKSKADAKKPDQSAGLFDLAPAGKSPTDAQRLARLKELFADYNAIGLTTICDRDSSAGALAQYQQLRDEHELTLRVAASYGVSYLPATSKIQEQIRDVSKNPLFTKRDPWLKIIGIKMYLDGGMLTGSAYMLQPWGVSAMYGISDPAYRGVRFIPPEKLRPVVRTAVENGLQFTAHSVGDGAVTALVDVYEEINRTLSVAKTRPCVTHCNFLTPEAIAKMARLGVVCDIQPAWLYLDSRTLHKQFGEARTRWFQPLKSLFAAGVTTGGGSDHMQKIGPNRSNNPYNPFLGIATAVTRRAKWFDGQMHPEEALTREQAIRFYTINNARLLFLEAEVGSLEPGKRADFVVLDRDILTCPEDQIAGIKPVATYVEGKEVFARQ
ncbi:MAG TPA: amidohydrolase [Verrucomicrobiae bacterium]|jgi:predicted amidohydrolase YtcJ